jgi:nicotinamide mononucleotide transporter
MFESFWEQLLTTSWIEWLGTLAGIVGVWLTIKEKAAAWPILIVCYSCYIFIAFDAKLYAMMLSQFVFIAISVYGWYEWVAGKNEDGEQLHISHTPPRKIIAVGLTLVVGTTVFGSLLLHYTDSTFAYLDGFSTVCAFVAQWMLARKYIETWICWILSDLIFIGIFIVQGYWMSVFLFTVFIFLAVRGWFHWKRTINQLAT